MLDELKQAKIESMRQSYPSLRVVSPEQDTVLIWEGTLQPLRYTDELDSILEDLEHDRTVLIVPGEQHEIRHDPNCHFEHQEHSLKKQISMPTREFTVRVKDFGDTRLPQATILEPDIPTELRRHFLGERICAFAPWQYPRDEGIVAFTDHSLIWLFKWNIFFETEPHVWIGSETEHDPEYLLKNIGSCDPCFCGSGNNFEKCHRSYTAYLAFGQPWLEFERWLSGQSSNQRRFEQLANRLAYIRSTSPFVKKLIRRRYEKGNLCSIRRR